MMEYNAEAISRKYVDAYCGILTDNGLVLGYVNGINASEKVTATGIQYPTIAWSLPNNDVIHLAQVKTFISNEPVLSKPPTPIVKLVPVALKPAIVPHPENPAILAWRTRKVSRTLTCGHNRSKYFLLFVPDENANNLLFSNEIRRDFYKVITDPPLPPDNEDRQVLSHEVIVTHGTIRALGVTVGIATEKDWFIPNQALSKVLSVEAAKWKMSR
jgi:hypothetical protein